MLDGSLFEEFLAPAGMTQAAFAEKIGWSRSRLTMFWASLIAVGFTRLGRPFQQSSRVAAMP